MCTAYKTYAMIGEKRSRQEIDSLQLLSETQARFRKGSSGIDNIYKLKISQGECVNLR